MSNSQIPKEPKKFTSNIVTNFYNDHYKRLENRNGPQIKFKNCPKNEDGKLIIDLTKYEALTQLNADFDEKKDINNVYDLNLHACLNLCDKLDIDTNSRSKKDKDIYTNFLEEHIVPQLWTEKINEYNVNDYYNAVLSLFECTDRLKIKLFNNIFPHGIHNPEKEKKGVNIVYLQHISKYHDFVLEKLIIDGKTEPEIIMLVQREFAREFANGNDQLLHPKIAKTIIDDESKSNKKSFDYKWISQLQKIASITKKGVSYESNLMDSDNIKEITELVRELLVVKSFLTNIKRGTDDEPNVKLSDAYSKYKRTLESVNEFYNDHKQISNDFPDFMVFFMESAKFLRDELEYKQPMKYIMDELKQKTDFKMNKNLIKKLTEIFTKDFSDEEIKSIVNVDCKLLPTKVYDFADTEIYFKLGKYCLATLNKKLRLGVGIAIVKYINDELDKLILKNIKKKNIIIHFKV